MNARRARAARHEHGIFPGAERRARHRQQKVPTEFTFGYLHPDGHCIHNPPCSPAGSKPYGGNELGSRCKPQDKQTLAHVSAADILFYGGAVGGGKSEYSIVQAVMLCLMHPGSKVAIFRRTRKELEQELMGRLILLTWAGDRHIKGPNGQPFAKYNSQQGKLTFWNGSEIWLCYCDRESHVYKYQSFQIIGLFIDEASHFTETMVKYLMTRVRSARSGVPKIIRFTSNPGGVGHGWLKRWFVKPVPGELHMRLADGSVVPRMPPAHYEQWRPWPDPQQKVRVAPDKMPTRQFIPAWFADNTALATADPDYLERAVMGLGGDRARQLAEGDWDANEGMIVGGLWEAHHFVRSTDTDLLRAFPHFELRKDLNTNPIPWHVLDDKRWRPPVGSHIFGSVDYGYGVPWSFHLHAALPGGHVRTFFEDYGPKRRDVKQADIIKRALTHQTFNDGKTALIEGLQWIVYDPSMKGSRMENGLAKTIIEVYQDENPRVQFLAGAAGRAARLSRPNRWMDALAPAPDGLPYWSCTTGCPDLIRTVPDVPWDEKDPDVEADESENHAYEDTGRFFEARPFAPRLAAEDPYKDLDPISAAHARAMDQRREGGSEIPTIYVPQ